MELSYYKKQKDALTAQISGFTTLLNVETLTAMEIAHISKAIDVMGINIDDHQELNAAMNDAKLLLASSPLSPEDR